MLADVAVVIAQCGLVLLPHEVGVFGGFEEVLVPAVASELHHVNCRVDMVLEGSFEFVGQRASDGTPAGAEIDHMVTAFIVPRIASGGEVPGPLAVKKVTCGGRPFCMTEKVQTHRGAQMSLMRYLR